MDTAAERRADQDPESAGKKTKLRRQDGTNQRPRTGDGCKVVPENHPAVCWHIILVVVLQQRRCGTLLIEHEHFCGQPFTVKTIADRQRAESSGNDPQRADMFAAR